MALCSRVSPSDRLWSTLAEPQVQSSDVTPHQAVKSMECGFRTGKSHVTEHQNDFPFSLSIPPPTFTRGSKYGGSVPLAACFRMRLNKRLKDRFVLSSTRLHTLSCRRIAWSLKLRDRGNCTKARKPTSTPDMRGAPTTYTSLSTAGPQGERARSGERRSR